MNTVITAKLLCLVFSAGPPDFWLTQQRKQLVCNHANLIIKESKKNKIEPTLLAAMITVESNWNHKAVSKAKACGLTQILPKYTGRITKKYTCKQLKNPRISIAAGAKILRWWIDYHKGKLTKKQRKKMSPDNIKNHAISRGLCGYNAGFRCAGKKPTRHGMRYSRKVVKLQKRIQALAYQKSLSL